MHENPRHNDACPERGKFARAKSSANNAQDTQQPGPGPSIVYEHSRNKRLSYPKWCATLVGNVLRTRTPFSSFVSKNLHLPRVTDTAPSYFPMPLPVGRWFERMNPDISLNKRRRIHENRAVCVIVLALNFWYNGGPVKSELLAKAPNAMHTAFYRRLRCLIRAEGPAEMPDLSASGRRMPQLSARLNELSDALTRLGPSCNPYDRMFQGCSVPWDTSPAEELRPYRDLGAERLKISGSGAWDPQPYLTEELLMAFREPNLLFLPDVKPGKGLYPLCTDRPAEIIKLAEVWDQKSLLFVHRSSRYLDRPHEQVKIFNNYKNSTADRQIGDRRGRNACEARVVGPSCNMPTGPDLCTLFCNPKSDYLCVSVTDRKDFYHQIQVTDSKALHNSVGPHVPEDSLKHLKGYQEYLLRSSSTRYDRSLHGDRLKNRTGLAPGSFERFHVAFKAILQGDHLGVDVATCAHINFLKENGLLSEENRLQSGRPLLRNDLCEGLVIDDYFVVSKQPHNISLQETKAAQMLEHARKCYNSQGILGSPEKDDLAMRAKVVGATVNSDVGATSRGLVTVGAPAEKRLSLSVITMDLCRLSHTSDALHLCLVGGWVSAFMYRRPLMGLFNKVFQLVDATHIDPNDPKLVALPRTVANELVLAAVLAPLIVSELSAPWHEKIFCSDASQTRGAYCSAQVGAELCEVLWKTSKNKGGYSRLLSPVEVALRRANVLEETQNFEDVHGPIDRPVPRPLAFRFDFVEVFAGSAKVTHYMMELGFSCCPPLDISESPHYNLMDTRVMEWLAHLISNRFIKGFMVEPPCTTFSIMRRPALRTKEMPYGLDPGDVQTRVGTTLALRGLQSMHLGRINLVPGLFESPWSAKVKNLPPWKKLVSHPEVSCIRTDSCRYGSPHLKSFAFVGVHTRMHRLALRCRCKKKHVLVQGQYTKASAAYVDELAQALAQTIADSIRDLFQDDEPFPVDGLESQLVNETVLSAPWEVSRSWAFKGKSHINILESSSFNRLVLDLTKLKKPVRVVALLDSNVARCALSKGRTSSRGLAPIIRRTSALALSAGIYYTLPFCPTRWNTADCPTRDKPLPCPIEGLQLNSWSRTDLFKLAGLMKLRRWASNWVRLVLLLLGPNVLSLADRSLFRQVRESRFPEQTTHFGALDFDMTLGYPGEGPVMPCINWISFANGFLCVLSAWGLLLSHSPLLSFALLVSLPVRAMPLFPRNAGDVTRAKARAGKPPLPSGRPVLQITKRARDQLLHDLGTWMEEQGIDLDSLLENAFANIEEINVLVNRYGRKLYEAGRPLNHYSETINALSSLKPQIRRSLQGCWDLAFSWSRQEPTLHHVAMPGPVLLAMLATCYLWGWLRMAGILALGFGAVLRTGELLQARRADLLLPVDTGFFASYALLAIAEPKTRFSTARHQSAKLDVPDLLETVTMAFSHLKPGEKLWNFSAQTLRARFKVLTKALDLPQQKYCGVKPLDMGSLRPGGATWLLQTTESGELVMRRGRWAAYKVMSIYLQEVSAITYLNKIPLSSKSKILRLAENFVPLHQKAISFLKAAIPCDLWWQLFQAQ